MCGRTSAGFATLLLKLKVGMCVESNMMLEMIKNTVCIEEIESYQHH